MFKPSLAGCLALILSLYSGTTSAKLEAHSNNEIPRTHQNIHLDGSLEEDAWLQALKISLNYEVSPGENIAAGTGTIAYLIEDGLFLYVGFKAEDSTPANIQAYLSERDDIEDSDFVSISLDTLAIREKLINFQ